MYELPYNIHGFTYEERSDIYRAFQFFLKTIDEGYRRSQYDPDNWRLIYSSCTTVCYTEPNGIDIPYYFVDSHYKSIQDGVELAIQILNQNKTKFPYTTNSAFCRDLLPYYEDSFYQVEIAYGDQNEEWLISGVLFWNELIYRTQGGYFWQPLVLLDLHLKAALGILPDGYDLIITPNDKLSEMKARGRQNLIVAYLTDSDYVGT